MSKRDQLCSLKFDEAIKIVEEYENNPNCEFWFRRGVWNSYEKISAEDAKKKIKSSSYGADIYLEVDALFISCPVDSDMW